MVTLPPAPVPTTVPAPPTLDFEGALRALIADPTLLVAAATGIGTMIALALFGHLRARFRAWRSARSIRLRARRDSVWCITEPLYDNVLAATRAGRLKWESDGFSNYARVRNSQGQLGWLRSSGTRYALCLNRGTVVVATDGSDDRYDELHDAVERQITGLLPANDTADLRDNIRVSLQVTDVRDPATLFISADKPADKPAHDSRFSLKPGPASLPASKIAHAGPCRVWLRRPDGYVCCPGLAVYGSAGRILLLYSVELRGYVAHWAGEMPNDALVDMATFA